MILDGKKVANEESKILKSAIQKLKKTPKLCIVQVGNIYESNKYIKNKIKKAKEVGIKTEWIKENFEINESDLIKKINNIKNNFDGIIVQLPLPSHINTQNVLDVIDLDKDVDGLSTLNMNNFYENKKPFFVPATARAILLMCEYYKLDLKNKKIMIIGESNLVGRPTKRLLSHYTNSIESRNKETGISGSENYDVLIVATGNPNLIKKENIKEGAIVIDVGINILDNQKIVGDVDYNDVYNKVHAITPVPGGIGPLTVICLLKNLVDKLI